MLSFKAGGGGRSGRMKTPSGFAGNPHRPQSPIYDYLTLFANFFFHSPPVSAKSTRSELELELELELRRTSSTMISVDILARHRLS